MRHSMGIAYVSKGAVPRGRYQKSVELNVPPPEPLVAGNQVFTVASARLCSGAYDGGDLEPGSRQLVLHVRVTNNDAGEAFTLVSRSFDFSLGDLRLQPDLTDGALDVEPVTTTDPQALAVDIPDYDGGVVTMVVCGLDDAGRDVRASATLTLPPP
jgi:hypothetical protein